MTEKLQQTEKPSPMPFFTLTALPISILIYLGRNQLTNTKLTRPISNISKSITVLAQLIKILGARCIPRSLSSLLPSLA